MFWQVKEINDLGTDHSGFLKTGGNSYTCNIYEKRGGCWYLGWETIHKISLQHNIKQGGELSGG